MLSEPSHPNLALVPKQYYLVALAQESGSGDGRAIIFVVMCLPSYLHICAIVPPKLRRLVHLRFSAAAPVARDFGRSLGLITIAYGTADILASMSLPSSPRERRKWVETFAVRLATS